MMWLALNLAAGLVTSAAIWSRIPTRARPLAVAAFLALMPVSWAIMQAGSGWAVTPTTYLADLPADAVILGLKFEPDVAIYLMLDVEGGPRMFKLRWSNQKASELQRAMEAAAGNGGPVKARRGQKVDGSDATFAGDPQPAAPEKQAEQPGLQYQRDAG